MHHRADTEPNSALLSLNDVEARAVLFEEVREASNTIATVEALQKTKTSALRRNMVLVNTLEKVRQTTHKHNSISYVYILYRNDQQYSCANKMIHLKSIHH